MSAYWLVKTEPNEFSFDDLLREGSTVWDGIRNYQARNNLMKMRIGDLVLVYHSVGPKQVVGIAKVSQAAYPDPTNNPNGTWQVVELLPVKPLARLVDLATLKATPALADIPLIRQSRLSVMPLAQNDFDLILSLAETTL